MQATHMFMLVRTEPDAPKHDGITYLLIDLDQPGVTRRPIRQMTGEAGDHTFCEFFFDNAETPVTWQVGERSEEHTSELQSLMRISYAVFCLKKKKHTNNENQADELATINNEHH